MLLQNQRLSRRAKTEQLFENRRHRSQRIYGSIGAKINEARRQLLQQKGQKQQNNYLKQTIETIRGVQRQQQTIFRNKHSLKLECIQQKERYLLKIRNKKANKIMNSILRKSSTEQCIQVKSNQKINIISHRNKYQELSNNYCELKSSGLLKDDKQLLNFIDKISECNSFLPKINKLLALSFLKIGKIKLIEEGQYLYKQQDPSISFYMLLWGQIKLKQLYSKRVMYCFPGDSLSQQIIFNRNSGKKQTFGNVMLVNKIQPKLQNAKSITKCGLLQLTKSEYGRVKKGFSQFGCKQQFNLADKILYWGLYKKQKFRK